jgi:hypothetical protein
MGKRSRKDRRSKRARERKRSLESDSPKLRSEQEVFEDIRVLAQSPGFIHALAALVFGSNTVTTSGEEFTPEDFQEIYKPDRLIRNETNLLVGLMLMSEVDVGLPDPQTFMTYVHQSIALLEELHQAIIAPGRQMFISALKEHSAGNEAVANPLSSGEVLREAIFYGGESAFTFQYEALAKERYAEDGPWLQAEMGFDINEAAEVLSIIRRFVNESFPQHLEALRAQEPHLWSWLPLFTFTIEDILQRTSLAKTKIQAVFDAFSVHEEDSELQISSAGDYNKAATHPLIRLRDGSMISLLEYGAYAALYDNPFYWIAKDKKYLGKHSQTRGSFVEESTEKILRRVFRDQYVHRNVVFKSSSGATIGEADAILIYGYRVFVVQAKSKRLTQPSWQGDDVSLARDFSAAVQQAYDQAIDCIRHIKNGELSYAGGRQIDLNANGPVREFYPICITSEHYPALSFQSGLFLRLQDEAHVLHPIVTDIFTLDVIAEMTQTPMYFTDYLIKRARAADRLQVGHELVALAWYIKKNLHIEENEYFALPDDIMVELDLAMSVRRTGISGRSTPEGQLTRFQGTPADRILARVNATDRPDVHRLGEIILGMNGEAAKQLNEGIAHVIEATLNDLCPHDVTIGLQGGGGISVHCNVETSIRARYMLQHHCEMRKYVQRADKWYGVSLGVDGNPRFMMGLEYPWEFDERLEAEAAPFRVRSITHAMIGARKIARNEKCPCGSGKKYKNCCLQ